MSYASDVTQEAVEQRERAEHAEARILELEAEVKACLDRGLAPAKTYRERAEKAEARVAELEAAICRHVRAREGESGERPDITVAALYRIEREIRAREAKAPTASVGNIQPVRKAAVSLIQREDGRVLCVWNLRYNGFSLPGGMVEDGETVDDALRRELREETSCEVASAELIFEGAHNLRPKTGDRGGRASVVALYRVTATGEPRETEPGCRINWLTWEEFLAQSPFGAFYREILPRLNEPRPGGGARYTTPEPRSSDGMPVWVHGEFIWRCLCPPEDGSRNDMSLNTYGLDECPDCGAKQPERPRTNEAKSPDNTHPWVDNPKATNGVESRPCNQRPDAEETQASDRLAAKLPDTTDRVSLTRSSMTANGQSSISATDTSSTLAGSVPSATHPPRLVPDLHTDYPRAEIQERIVAWLAEIEEDDADVGNVTDDQIRDLVARLREPRTDSAKAERGAGGSSSGT